MSSSKNLLQINNGSKSFGSQILFDGASFSINEGEHVGVIGPNGAGKSTLFRILIGEDEFDSGTIVRSQSLRLGYLSQHDHWAPDETGNSYLEKICRLPIWETKSLGKELQVAENIYSKPIMSLSGGYRMRIKLIGLLGMDPNLMMLDEPTNYLDLETTLLLERFLQNYHGAFLLISHDREVLRRTTDHILEVEATDVVKFSGNIDDYFEQKELLRAQLQAQAQNQALKRKAVMEFVTRFGAKASKAKQAQSRMKSLEKMEAIEFKPVPTSASIKIPQPPHVGKTVLTLEKTEFSYQQNLPILKNVSLEIKRGDHVAVVGFNGAGKSTLLKGIAGTLAPAQGQRTLGYQVEIAIFNQHVIEVLKPEQTVFESLEEVAPGATPQEIRNMAGSLLFSSDHIQKKIKVLSGGEKSRVALGRILLQKVPCLLLDEPTNHLDFQTVEALTQALNNYVGTLVVVSHDRGFIRRVGTKILEVKDGNVHVFPGTYDEYVWSLQKQLAVEDSVTVEIKSVKPSELKAPTSHAEKKELERKKRQIEKEINTCEMQIAALEEENQILNQKIIEGGPNIHALINKMTDNTTRLQQLESSWLQKTEERERLS